MSTVRRSMSDSAIALFSTVTVTADALSSTVNAGAKLATELERRADARLVNVDLDLKASGKIRKQEILKGVADRQLQLLEESNT